MTTRAIIAEDEPLARQCLRTMAEANDIQVLAECNDGDETLAALRRFHPELLFLDIEMPGVDGFGVLRALDPEMLPVVIFTTAYDQYAVRAFDCGAVDYLLKPFDEERFGTALKRARLRLQDVHSQRELTSHLLSALQNSGQFRTGPQKLVIRSGGQVTFVQVNEIDWIEAAGNYVRIHAGSDAHMLREPISCIETQLEPAKFMRIHRSLIVNVDRIRRLEACGYGEYLVVLHDGKKLSLSRGYRDRLDRFLDDLLSCRKSALAPMPALAARERR